MRVHAYSRRLWLPSNIYSGIALGRSVAGKLYFVSSHDQNSVTHMFFVIDMSTRYIRLKLGEN